MDSYPLLANLSTRSVNQLTAWAYGYAVRNPKELSPKAWQDLPYYYGPALTRIQELPTRPKDL